MRVPIWLVLIVVIGASFYTIYEGPEADRKDSKDGSLSVNYMYERAPNLDKSDKGTVFKVSFTSSMPVNVSMADTTSTDSWSESRVLVLIMATEGSFEFESPSDGEWAPTFSHDDRTATADVKFSVKREWVEDQSTCFFASLGVVVILFAIIVVLVYKRKMDNERIGAVGPFHHESGVGRTSSGPQGMHGPPGQGFGGSPRDPPCPGCGRPTVQTGGPGQRYCFNCSRYV